MKQSTQLTRWLAEFRDPQREAMFLAYEERAHHSALRIGLGTVAVAVTFSLWMDLKLIAESSPSHVRDIVVARTLELVGLALGATTPFRKRLAYPSGWAFVVGCGLLSVGHQLASLAIFAGAGRPVNGFWAALFTFLSLTAFIHPLRFAIAAAMQLFVGALLVRAFVLPFSLRELSLDCTALLLTFGTGVALNYRLNRARRLEFANLEIERQTNLLLTDEVKERVRHEDNLLAHTTELEARLLTAQRLEAIGRLAGGVAHDLNNLLTPILSYTELAMVEIGDLPEVTSLLVEVIRAADSAKELVAQLLAFGRRQHLNVKRFNLVALLKEQEPLLRTFLRDGIELSLALKESQVWVLADRTQLVQVLMNIIVNARDAIAEDGWVRVELDCIQLDEPSARDLGLTKSGLHVRIAVVDNGIGMDEATRQRVFEPFFTTKEVGKGTGLGLSTVYGIIAQHLGSIQVESRIGQGTSFSIFLPVAETAEPELESMQLMPLNLRGGSETILVVDDDMVVRELLARLLRRSGYVVLVAGSGDEALAVAGNQKYPIDLLISDVVMDKMRGPVLWERIHKLFPSASVLFVSGYADEASLGGVGAALLQKPFTRAALISRVRQILDARRT